MSEHQIVLQDKHRILFIGDSITDVDRNRADESDLGSGFPKFIAELLLKKYPGYQLTFFNRGISGDEVRDLKNRWKKDCLALQPDLVTILVGINDVYFKFEKNEKPTSEELAQFEADYRFLLESLAEQTKAQVVLMEPFLLPYPKDRRKWRKQLDPRIQIVRHLAKEFGAVLVPLDGILNAHGIANEYQDYTGEDGVHPTVFGHAAIVEAWFDYLGL